MVQQNKPESWFRRDLGRIRRPVIPKMDYSQIRMFPDEEAQVHTLDTLPARAKHIPSVTCIFGRRGQGKTLLATTMAKQRQERCRRMGTKHRLYSNYWIDSADRSDQHIVEELQEFPAWLDESPFSTLVIDEVAELLPSLRPMASDNLLTMGFLKQIRKRGVSVIMATQYPQEVTMGTLRQCDWFIRCEAIQGGRHLRSFWWDWPGNITGNWGRKYFPPERDTHDFAFGYSNTFRMWGSYRSEEIIAPRWVEENRREEIRAEQEKRRLGIAEDDIPAAARPLSPGKRNTTGIPAGVQAIIEDAPGSAVGVVLVKDIAKPLRDLWHCAGAQVSELVFRLETIGVQVMKDRGDPYLVYDAPATAPGEAS